MVSSKKDVAILLSTVEGFDNPKAELEQYITPSEIAAELVWNAYMDGNINGKSVVDLGCGTGILSFGAALLGAKSVVGYDLDERAIEIAKQNEKILAGTKIPMCEIEFVREDVRNIVRDCDTVVMNPPFGVQKKQADRVFLAKAFELSGNVYSIHKFGTGRFVEEFAKAHGFSAFRLATRTFKLKPTMKFHREQIHPAKVSLWRFSKD